jgi:hypothetical protein
MSVVSAGVKAWAVNCVAKFMKRANHNYDVNDRCVIDDYHCRARLFKYCEMIYPGNVNATKFSREAIEECSWLSAHAFTLL